MANHPRQAVPQVQSTLAKLSLCRTAALGGRRLRCESCDHRCVVYNSCGDRHCPQCRGARRAGWVESSRELLLPEVDYFQVVFTLPAEFSALALGNRRELYNLLFTAAWQALREVIGEACGFETAALMVLHTWNQRLGHHPHVHALVPGGGPSLRGDRWIKSRHPQHRCKQKPYLVDNRRLSARFRQLFLRGVTKLHRQGMLRLGSSPATSCTSDALVELLAQLASRDWVVYIEPPPHESASAEQVLKYLARYMAGGPISDRRLVSHGAGKVTFLARSRDKPTDGGRPKQIPVALRGDEFVRRWCLHILPKNFTKVRRFGGYSNRHCQAYARRCRELLGLTDGPPSADCPDVTLPEETGEFETSPTRCPHCRSQLVCLTQTARPSWSLVMASGDRPLWYRDG